MRGRIENLSRLKTVLLHDKLLLPNNFEEVLKSEISSLLDNYMSVRRDTVDINISVNQDGEYEIVVKAYADRLKNTPIVI
ncbi:MAG: cell division topological specificity factor MinE [Clostridia bacterium]|nr:cell division topological specificity factor MinE [Clostridia bacterium]